MCVKELHEAERSPALALALPPLRDAVIPTLFTPSSYFRSPTTHPEAY